MSVIKQLYIVLCCLVLAACGESTVLHDSHGNAIDLSAYKGQWVFINYWATWCDTCREEIPGLNAFYKAHRNRDGILLGVNYDHVRDPHQLQKLKQQLHIEFPLLKDDPRALFNSEELTTVPVTMVINPAGKWVENLYGPQTRASLEAKMKKETS